MRPLAWLVFLILASSVCSASKPSLFDEQKGEWEDINSPPSSAQMPLPGDSWKSPSAEIFVGISHYRDARCSETLANLFQKAAFPDRVHVGIIAHIHTEEDRMHCKRDYCSAAGHSLESGRCPHAERISQIDVSFKDARAPGVSRYMQQQLLGVQEFCLQVDAHSDFAAKWDSAMLETWASAKNEYAIISTKPPDLADLKSNEGEINHVCQTSFSSGGVPRNLLPRRARGLTAPLLAPLWSAGFSFSKCHAILKAPYDPNLPYVFDGEEFLQTAKFWTRGYDVYSPDKVLVVHDNAGKMKNYKALEAVKRSNVPADKAWATNGQSPEYKRVMYDEALERVKTILDMEGGRAASPDNLAAIQRYGLGTKRKLDDFFQFTGVDTRQGILFSDACKARSWVPFAPDSDPHLEDGDLWGLAPEVLRAGDGSVPLLVGGTVEFVSPPTAAELETATTPALPLPVPVVAPQLPRARSNPNPLQNHPILWGVFLPIDSALEALVVRVQELNQQSRGAAVRLVKLALLIIPAAALLLIIAVMTVMGKSIEDGSTKSASLVRLEEDREFDLGKRI